MPNDPKQIWKSQPEESSEMTLDEIRRRALALHNKTRKDLLQNITVTAGLVLLAAFGIGRGVDPLQQAAYAVVVVWALAGLFFFGRGMWDAEPGSGTGIELYRQEIERRRSFFHRVMRWSFGPMVLALAVFILDLNMKAGPGDLYPKAAPFLVLVAAWIAAYFYMRREESQALRQEIESLNRLENQG